MTIINAAEARHRAQVFWFNNNARAYNEKVMAAIINAAEGGKRQLRWDYALDKDMKMWLYSLGYSIQVINENSSAKTFQYIIGWK